MTNPYESPTAAPSEDRSDHNRRVAIALIPFVIAVFVIPIAAYAWLTRSRYGDAASTAVGIAEAILIFDLPVCVWVAIDWLRTGYPPPLNLSPLIPTREERQFHKRLRTQPQLDDRNFYDVYFADTQVPDELPGRLRKTLEEIFGIDFAGLDPDDCLVLADCEIDWADVVIAIEREFKIVFPREAISEAVTFRSLLDCIGQAMRRENRASVE